VIGASTGAGATSAGGEGGAGSAGIGTGVSGGGGGAWVAHAETTRAAIGSQRRKRIPMAISLTLLQST
jgi:hypothetical protein